MNDYAFQLMMVTVPARASIPKPFFAMAQRNREAMDIAGEITVFHSQLGLAKKYKPRGSKYAAELAAARELWQDLKPRMTMAEACRLIAHKLQASSGKKISAQQVLGWARRGAFD